MALDETRTDVPVNVDAPPGGANPTYHGGRLLSNVQVQPLFWGAAWQAAAQNILIGQLEGFLGVLVTSSQMDLLREYSVPPQIIHTGSVLPTVRVPTSEPGGATKAIVDATMGAQVDTWVSGDTLQSATDALYVVFLPPGVTCTDQNGKVSCQPAPNGICGYHNQSPNGNAYAVLPFVNCAVCSSPGLTLFQSFTVFISHELCEAVTDPDAKNGWWDSRLSGNEIGDFCAATQPLGNFTIQRVWSNGQNACVAAPPIYQAIATGPGNGGRLQVVALAADTFAYLAAWQDTDGRWFPGDLKLPGQSVSLSQVVTGTGNDGYLQVIGLGTADGLAHLAGWQDGTGAWNSGAGTTLSTAGSPRFSQLVTGAGNGGNLQVIGLGATDGRAHLAAWQDSGGQWHPEASFVLSGPSVQYSQLVTGNGNDGFLQVIGLDAADGLAHLAAWQDGDGNWHREDTFLLPQAALPCNQLVAANGNNGFLQVIGLSERRAILVSWQDGNGNWHSGGGRDLGDPNTAPAERLACGNGNGGALQVIGLTSAGSAMLLAWQDGGGGWHPMRLQLSVDADNLATIATGTGNAGFLQVVGLEFGVPHLAAWQDGAGNWGQGRPLP